MAWGANVIQQLGRTVQHGSQMGFWSSLANIGGRLRTVSVLTPYFGGTTWIITGIALAALACLGVWRHRAYSFVSWIYAGVRHIFRGGSTYHVVQGSQFCRHLEDTISRGENSVSDVNKSIREWVHSVPGMRKLFFCKLYPGEGDLDRRIKITTCLSDTEVRPYVRALLNSGINVVHISFVNSRNIDGRISDACKDISSLGFDGCRSFAAGSLAKLNSWIRRGASLYFSRVRITAADFEHVEGSNLHKLCFNCCLIDDSVLEVIKDWKTIKHLELHRCPNITDSGVAKVLASLTALESLDIGRCERVTGAYGHDDTLRLPFASLESLRSVHLEECVDLNNEDLNAVIDHASSLSEISVSDCPKYTQDIVIKALLRKPTLVNLDCSGCTFLTDDSLKRDERDYSVESFLRELNMNRCVRITDEGITHLLTWAKKLEVLRVCGSKITGAIVPSLLENARNLRMLDVSGCRSFSQAAFSVLGGLSGLEGLIAQKCNIDDGLLSKIGRRGCLEGLRVLDVSGCPITDRGVADLMRSSGGWRELVFKECAGVNDRALQSVGNAISKNLEHFDISGCREVTHEGIAQLQGQPIRRLYLRGCTGLTDDIWDCLEGFDSLEYLDLRGCTGVSAAKIEAFNRDHAGIIVKW